MRLHCFGVLSVLFLVQLSYSNEHVSKYVTFLDDGGNEMSLSSEMQQKIADVFKTEKIDVSTNVIVQKQGNNLVLRQQPLTKTAFPWQKLSGSDLLHDHYKNGLDPTQAVNTIIDNHARAFVALPWGETGYPERREILTRIQTYYNSLPTHSPQKIEAKFKCDVLEELFSSPTVITHGAVIKNHLLMLQSNQNTIRSNPSLYSSSSVRNSVTIAERLTWLQSLSSRQNDTFTNIIELCARFALIGTGTSNMLNESVPNKLSWWGNRVVLVKMAEALLFQGDQEQNLSSITDFLDLDCQNLPIVKVSSQTILAVQLMKCAFIEGPQWVSSQYRNMVNLVLKNRNKGKEKLKTPVDESGMVTGIELTAEILFSLISCRISKPSPDWVYEWCHERMIRQWLPSTNQDEKNEADHFLVGTYFKTPIMDQESTHIKRKPMILKSGLISSSYQVDRYSNGSKKNCQTSPHQPLIARHANVALTCCNGRGKGAEGFPLVHSTMIRSVFEKSACSYDITVCIPFACTHHPHFAWWSRLNKDKQAINDKQEGRGQTELENMHSWNVSPLKKNESQHAINVRNQRVDRTALLKERVKTIIHDTYDSYMQHAYPAAELRPLTCSGGDFNLVNISGVTLIDALDTLAVIGNYSEFRLACDRVVELFMDDVGGRGGGSGGFDIDVTVSVFEATIRVLGGLLSAHLLIENPHWWLPSSSSSSSSPMFEDDYNGELLALAVDLGERLLPAFNSPTGIPYGSVNLRRGVARSETPVASLAGAGSLTLEFQKLSELSGDDRFGCAARGAVLALFLQRSQTTGLLGKHIDVVTGKWTEQQSGLGFTADSYYEYLAKMFFLYYDQGSWKMFSAVATSLEAYTKFGDWYADVELHSGLPTRSVSDALQGFWPGLLTMVGDKATAARTLNAFLSIQAHLDSPGAPEEFDFLRWELPSSGSGGRQWLLRPEVLESIYHVRRAAINEDPNGADSWLEVAEATLGAIEKWAQVNAPGCGFATVRDITDMKLSNSMPSFFISETLKYLYLIFDDDNWVHNNKVPFIFTTEGHLFPVSSHLKKTNYNQSWRDPRRRDDGGMGVNTNPFSSQCDGFHKVVSFAAASSSSSSSLKKSSKVASDMIKRIATMITPDRLKSLKNDKERTRMSLLANINWPFREDTDALPQHCPSSDYFKGGSKQDSILKARFPPGNPMSGPCAARGEIWPQSLGYQKDFVYYTSD